jgi:hypothetical protein
MATAHAVNATVKYFAYLKNLNRIMGYATKANAIIAKRTDASFIVKLTCIVLSSSSKYSGIVEYVYNAEKQKE